MFYMLTSLDTVPGIISGANFWSSKYCYK